MLKTISAALLAASMITAPAFAAETGKTTAQTPVIKADQTQTKMSTTGAKSEVKSDVKTGAKADVKADANKSGARRSEAKTKAMNANAAIAPAEHHKSVRSHRHHHKMVSARKTQPDLTKPAAPVTTGKRG
jgi:hypothetical protein